MKPRHQKIAATAILNLMTSLILCGIPSSSKADPDSGTMGAIIIGGIILGLGEVATVVSGAVYAIGDAYGIANDENRGTKWHVGSYVTGGLNIAIGTGVLFVHTSASDSWIKVVAASQLTLGCLEIGLALWNRTMPEPGDISVSPMVMTDSTGHLAFGIGATVINW